MEPPTAKEIIKQENSYSIISDKNHTFNLIFQNLNSTIGILASYENDFIKHNYEKKLILDELKQNKYLALCDSIDEIYEELITLMKKNQFKIIEETNQIYISIPVEYVKVKNDSEKINELFSIISNMKKEMKEFKEQIKNEEINNLKKEIKDLKEKNVEEIQNMKENNSKEINNLKEEIKNLKDEIKNMKENNLKEIKEENKNLKKEINELNSFIPYLKEYKKKSEEKKRRDIIINLDSLIIKDNINYNITLKNWINGNMEIKSELLYRMSRDGIEYSTFHKLCDNKGPTIVLTKLTDGNILGLYTPLDWDSKSEWKSDLNMFVFSLTQNLKCMKNNQNNRGIYCNTNYGPYSSFLQFNIYNTMNKPYIAPSNVGFNDCQKLYPGKSNGFYDAEEVEVYKIIIG